MKNAMPYLIVVAASFLLAGTIVVGIFVLRPDMLTWRLSPQAAPDSAVVASTPRYLREIAGPTYEELHAAPEAGKDSLALMRDSVSTLLTALDQERKKIALPEKALEEQGVALPAAVVAVDTAAIKRQKSRARLLEAMPAEDAAKILARLSDDETKSLLQYIKARQAAKIMAAIEPERASRLLR